MTLPATAPAALTSSESGGPSVRLVSGGRLIPRGDDLADLLDEHGTYSAVARLLGVSANGVSYAAKLSGLTSPRLRGGRRYCAVCRTTSGEGTILRFVMAHYTDADGVRTTRGAGTIYLCEPCWRAATSEARILPRRSYRRAA